MASQDELNNLSALMNRLNTILSLEGEDLPF